jgi:MFS family permease
MSEQKKSRLTIIFFTVFIYLVGFGVIIPLTPILGRDFGATATQIGLLMSVYSLMQFLFSPYWGRLSDRVGRRPVLLGCLLGEGLAYLLFASARNLEILFLARALAGFFGASISTASAYISDVTPANERSKGMALIGAAFGLGFIVGPALGGGLTMLGNSISSEPHFGTSFALIWVAVICFLNFLFGLKFLAESLPESERRSAQDKKENRLTLFFKYFKVPMVGSLMSVFFINSLAFSTMEATLVLLVGDRFGWGIKEVSFGFAFIGVLSTLNQGFTVRKLLPILGEKKMMAIGLTALSISLAGIAVASEVWQMGVVMTLLSFGYAFTNPATLGSISLLTPGNEQGAAMGTTQGLASLGRILGPAYGGFVYGVVHPTAPFLTASLLGLGALSIVLSQYSKLPASALNKSI